jgi:hypothetical protein
LPTSNTNVIPSPQLQAYTLAKLATTDPGAIPLYKDAFNLWNNAPGASSLGFTPTILASVIAPVNPVCTAIHGSATPCFTTSDFITYNSTSGVSTPIHTNFGATGTGVFRGPGYFDVDTNLYKRFAIREKYGLELGV